MCWLLWDYEFIIVWNRGRKLEESACVQAISHQLTYGRILPQLRLYSPAKAPLCSHIPLVGISSRSPIHPSQLVTGDHLMRITLRSCLHPPVLGVLSFLHRPLLLMIPELHVGPRRSPSHWYPNPHLLVHSEPACATTNCVGDCQPLSVFSQGCQNWDNLGSGHLLELSYSPFLQHLGLCLGFWFLYYNTTHT